MIPKEMAEEQIKKWDSVLYPQTYPVALVKDFIRKAFIAGLKAGRPKWHKLSEKYPEADKIVRVRLVDGMEHICETCYYEPTEDEIGYGKFVINFYELNGEWVDDTEIIAWCEVPKYTEE